MDNWRTSSYSSGSGGQCVATASADGAVTVRDSTDRNGSMLTISATAWSQFLTRVR
ncbi:MAG TPA: DUF397 domain-containing protein [Trebonia sp.]